VEQGVDLVVIKELLGHAHIRVTAGVYAHVRLRLQRRAIDTLGNALGLTDEDPEDPPGVLIPTHSLIAKASHPEIIPE
jgi:integrase